MRIDAHGRGRGGREVKADPTQPAPRVDPDAGHPAAQRRRLTAWILLLPGAAWLLVFFVIPTFTLMATSLWDPSGSLLDGYRLTGHWRNYVDAVQFYGPQFWRSFLYAGLATAACVLLGYPLAYAIAFKAGRWMNL
ncbi:MAG: hypothetical protein PVH00_09235, partial [Gemmatimonadota bacterium]